MTYEEVTKLYIHFLVSKPKYKYEPKAAAEPDPETVRLEDMGRRAVERARYANHKELLVLNENQIR